MSETDSQCRWNLKKHCLNLKIFTDDGVSADYLISDICTKISIKLSPQLSNKICSNLSLIKHSRSRISFPPDVYIDM